MSRRRLNRYRFSPDFVPATRSVAKLTNVTKFPSRLKIAELLPKLPPARPMASARLTRTFCPLRRSNKKMSERPVLKLLPPLLSTKPATKSVASLG